MPDGRDDPLDDPVFEAAADKLKATFDGATGVVSDGEVDAAVRDAATSLENAPVKSFVPLIAENKARKRLQALKQQRESRS